MLGLDLGADESDDGEEFAPTGKKMDFIVETFNENVNKGGGLGAMFGNQGGGHQGGNNKALQYRWKKYFVGKIGL